MKVWETGTLLLQHLSPSLHSMWATARKIPIDMAGFAINLRSILTRPEVWLGRDVRGRDSRVGQLETDLLEHFTTRDRVECRGSNSEVFFNLSPPPPPPPPLSLSLSLSLSHTHTHTHTHAHTHRYWCGTQRQQIQTSNTSSTILLTQNQFLCNKLMMSCSGPVIRFCASSRPDLIRLYTMNIVTSDVPQKTIPLLIPRRNRSGFHTRAVETKGQ